ncbi:MAG: Uma2 family endonuclease [Aggregatilineales bacterium]
MVISEQPITKEAFFDFIQQPENADHDYELIEGRIVAVVSHGESSASALRIGGLFTIFLINHDIGRVTGADGGYIVNGYPYIPDVAYMSYARQAEPEYDRGYNILAPDLAVEVLSPTDGDITPKVVNYLNAGTVVWVANPATYVITVYVPGEKPDTRIIGQTLSGGDVLPGFSIAVKDAFPDYKSE